MDEAVTADEKDMYKSTLEFQSITTEYVGRYYCVYNSSIKLNAENYEQEVKRYKASSIYVFVDGEISRWNQLNHEISSQLDPDNLLVENHEHNVVIGIQYEPFVIPCKPTSPKVKVELMLEDGEVTIITYNDTIGFLIVGNEIVTTFLMCVGHLGNNSAEFFITVYIDRRFSKMYISSIFTHLFNHIYEHNWVRLICVKNFQTLLQKLFMIKISKVEYLNEKILVEILQE